MGSLTQWLNVLGMPGMTGYFGLMDVGQPKPGETVVVSSDEVKAPVAVRYGWANNPPCFLYNAADLPAAPFRTDH
jgi:hypothetical protein